MSWIIDFYKGVEDVIAEMPPNIKVRIMKKSQKTPKKDLDLAKTRMKEVRQ